MLDETIVPANGSPIVIVAVTTDVLDAAPAKGIATISTPAAVVTDVTAPNSASASTAVPARVDAVTIPPERKICPPKANKPVVLEVVSLEPASDIACTSAAVPTVAVLDAVPANGIVKVNGAAAAVVATIAPAIGIACNSVPATSELLAILPIRGCVSVRTAVPTAVVLTITPDNAIATSFYGNLEWCGQRGYDRSGHLSDDNAFGGYA